MLGFGSSKVASLVLCLHGSFLGKQRSSWLHQKNPFLTTRSSFLLGFASSAAAWISTTNFKMAMAMSSQSTNNSQARIDAAVQLLNSVYGPVDSPNFPKPLPKEEAGVCAHGDQRRYLWTDAFGVLAYLSLSDYWYQLNDVDHDANANANANQAQRYQTAAHRLVDTVHKCLGTPRSDHPNDAMRPSDLSPTGFVGLRIGKVESRSITDYHGMQYDGQYWHYLDKWLIALTRCGRVPEGIALAKSAFPYFFVPGPDGGGAIQWKLSVNASGPLTPSTPANDDTLMALIVLSLLETHRPTKQDDDDGGNNKVVQSLEQEIGLLKTALQGYEPRVTDDPLGWGLEATFDQFLVGQPRTRALASIQDYALNPQHLSLPFRLYGALIGARVAGKDVASPDTVEQLLERSLEHEFRAMASGHEAHSSINRVMLAMCLLSPGVLKRRPEDPLIDLRDLH